MLSKRKPINTLAALSLLLTPAALADDFDLSWFTIDGGGEMRTSGGDFELSGTIGQSDANGVVLTGGDFELTGGFWPVAVSAPPPPCPGDFNCDGKRDFDDIDPFVEALSTGKCKCLNFANCDPNGDSKIDFKDIDAFIPLIGVPCP